MSMDTFTITVSLPPTDANFKSRFKRSASTGSLLTGGIGIYDNKSQSIHVKPNAGTQPKETCQVVSEQTPAPPTSPPRLKSCMSVGSSLNSLCLKKNVAFHNIEIREHPRELGDHPSVTSGPPLSLGWYNEDGITRSMPLEDYEQIRPPRRSRVEFIVDRTSRETLLREEAGVTTKEMERVSREIAKTKQQRQQTASRSAGTERLPLLFESAKRQVKRLVTISSAKKEQEELWKRAARRVPNRHVTLARSATTQEPPHQGQENVPKQVMEREEEKDPNQLQPEQQSHEQTKHAAVKKSVSLPVESTSPPLDCFAPKKCEHVSFVLQEDKLTQETSDEDWAMGYDHDEGEYD